MDVPEVWIIDPETKAAHILRPDTIPQEVREGSLKMPSLGIDLPLAQLFVRPGRAAE
jgi:Uma2 family endonuclease